MEAIQMLHSFRNIDKKISVEVEAMEMGKSLATELLFTIDQTPENEDRLQKAKNHLRQQEIECLYSFRRLMTIKYNCMRGFIQLDKDAAALLYARAVEEKGWAEIAGEFQYSESQMRRRYNDALKLFARAVVMNGTCT